MERNELEERIKQEIDMEALILERRVSIKKELASMEMPRDSYEQLMKKIQSKSNSNAKRIPAYRKAITTVALVGILITMAGVGVNGARLYVIKSEKQQDRSIYDITTDSEDNFYVDLTEEEAYKRIEEEMGFFALRLSNKPTGMQLKEVAINVEMGEVLMEFHYNEQILTIYENKQNRNASFSTQLDGEVIDAIEIFHLGKNIKISEVNNKNGEMFYTVQLEYGNAYYYITSNLDLETFKDIICGIIFVNNNSFNNYSEKEE